MKATRHIPTNGHSWLVGFRNTPNDPTIWLFSNPCCPGLKSDRLEEVLFALEITNDRWSDHGSATMACIAGLLPNYADETYEHEIYAGDSDLPHTNYQNRYLITWNEPNPPPPRLPMLGWPTEPVTTLATINNATGETVAYRVLLPYFESGATESGEPGWFITHQHRPRVCPIDLASLKQPLAAN